MIKKSDAGIKASEDEDSKTRSIAVVANNQEITAPQRSSIVLFNLAQWKEMARTYEVEQSDVPRRTSSKFFTREE